jgi:hypothetical protein
MTTTEDSLEFHRKFLEEFFSILIIIRGFLRIPHGNSVEFGEKKKYQRQGLKLGTQTK